MDVKQYKELAKKHSPATKSRSTVPAAFVTGGAICAIGQCVNTIYLKLGFSAADSGTMTSMTMVLAGVALTAAHVYDRLAKFAGAGTLVPITGFANSVASPAVEFKTEGIVLGTCVKMFTIAGPVLTLGVTASVIYGLILLIAGGGA